MVIQEEMKHVAILQKQGYCLYNKCRCHDSFNYYHIVKTSNT